MKIQLYIKNMVCDRCKSAVEDLLHHNGAKVDDIQLGRVTFTPSKRFDFTKFKAALIDNGFELIENYETKLVEQIKLTLINSLEQKDGNKKISSYLSEKIGKEYSVLSKIFKKTVGQTLEKYLIHLKIERTKELIQMRSFSFSEIAYKLGYNSISHLSSQFKSITGMTMSNYQSTQRWNRSPLDKIL